MMEKKEPEDLWLSDGFCFHTLVFMEVSSYS